ncbi:hypothetical protein CDD80_2768 [Ophiocordyceps camponoti-rufipedis]|uniref:Heterokaryon incompatibility domain-containing protein n=1 Tax=Ophiocordyceps camponoti-rufipedis TaxID=2004952 RepID=A0A2C5Z4H1_9HYPO|nr:hypothetical protein CDD80_2768 [Ophiocordyceps camponoti-rufipedis]
MSAPVDPLRVAFVDKAGEFYDKNVRVRVDTALQFFEGNHAFESPVPLLPVEEAEERIRLARKIQLTWKAKKPHLKFTNVHLSAILNAPFSTLKEYADAPVKDLKYLALYSAMEKMPSLLDSFANRGGRKAASTQGSITGEKRSALPESSVESKRARVDEGVKGPTHEKGTEPPKDATKTIPRKQSEAVKAKKRDESRCVVTGHAGPESCHIIPFTWNNSAERNAHNAGLLQPICYLMFPDDIDGLNDLFVPGGVGATDRAWNLINLNRTLHQSWAKFAFGFKWLGSEEVDRDNSKVTIQLHWLPAPKDVKPDDEVGEDLGTTSGLLSKLRQTPRAANVGCHFMSSAQPVLTGNTFSLLLPKADAVKFSLVVKLQWALVRVGAMAGAANDRSFWGEGRRADSPEGSQVLSWLQGLESPLIDPEQGPLSPFGALPTRGRQAALEGRQAAKEGRPPKPESRRPERQRTPLRRSGEENDPLPGSSKAHTRSASAASQLSSHLSPRRVLGEILPVLLVLDPSSQPVMSRFVYQPLTPNQGEIRLIHLLPKPTAPISTFQPPSGAESHHDPPVACSISHVSLHNPPPYMALSYTWGDMSQTAHILVDDALFLVTKSLEVALLHLTPQQHPLTLWIDAVCINQDDSVEKTEQVEQMKHIYSLATSVTAWLGPSADNSDAAMRWIQRYGSLARDLGIGTTPELRLRPLLHTLESDPDKLPQRLRDFLADISAQLSTAAGVGLALSHLFSRSFWSRAWVVQEVVHGERLQFVCGRLAVSDELIHYSLRLLRNHGQYERLKTQSTGLKLPCNKFDVLNPVNIFKIRRAIGPFPLIYLIRTLKHFKATDPRDKIFALVSFASDAAAMGLHPDYRKPCEEIYMDTTVALLKNGFFDILSLCGENDANLDLPSWVPALTSMKQRVPQQQRAMNRTSVPVTTDLQPKFSASGCRPSVSISVWSPKTLLLQAKLVDVVTRVGSAWKQQALDRWIEDLKEFTCPETPALEPHQLKTVWRTAVADQEIRHGPDKPRLSTLELDKVHASLRNLDLRLADKQTFAALGLSNYIYQLQEVASGRRPFCTRTGRVGIGPGAVCAEATG